MRTKAKGIVLLVVILQIVLTACNTYRNLDQALANPDDVRVLKIKNKNLQTLPPEIGALKNLEYLDLQYNGLNELPPEIGGLKRLEFIYLNNNELDTIPNEIGKLESLRYFVIGKNSLSELPSEMGDLEYLIELNLVNSGPMLVIPPSVANLRYLEFLFIDNSILFPYPFISMNPRLQIVVQ